MQELVACVETVKPDVIGITETWGNDEILDAEFCIPGFTLFRQDRKNSHRGGGVLLLINSCMNAIEVKMKSQFVDQVWCSIKLKGGEDLLIGVCYHSPNPDFSHKENDNKLCDLFTELYGKPLLLMGDYNYPDIDWSSLHGLSTASQKFVDAIEDGFLTQHVLEATCNGSVLDLVITSEPDMIDSISMLEKLGNGDHNMMVFSTHLCCKDQASVKADNYRRGDFGCITECLSGIDWDDFMTGNTETSWIKFSGLLMDLVNQYVPIKVSACPQKFKKPVWMSHKAVKLVKMKRKVYRRYKDTSHPAVRAANSKAQKELRKSVINFEKKLALNIKSDRKSFFAYVRSMNQK